MLPEENQPSIYSFNKKAQGLLGKLFIEHYKMAITKSSYFQSPRSEESLCWLVKSDMAWIKMIYFTFVEVNSQKLALNKSRSSMRHQGTCTSDIISQHGLKYGLLDMNLSLSQIWWKVGNS